MTCDHRLGLSALAIKYRGHTDHPHDPGDLARCIAYCQTASITPDHLRQRMAGRSPQWDALLPHWETLVTVLDNEREKRRDGRAPGTYALMRALLDGAA